MNSSILIASIILVLVFLFVIICIFNFALRKGKRIIDFIILKIIVEFMVLVLMVYNGLVKRAWGYLDAAISIATFFSIWQSLSDLIIKLENKRNAKKELE